MSQYIETPCRTFQANAAIAQHLRVALSSNKLVAADAVTREIGTMDRASTAADEYVAVRLVSAQGTAKMVAAGAITVGSTVYSAASGKVNDAETANGHQIGIALDAATADGDVIEVLRMPQTFSGGLSNDLETVVAAAPTLSAYGTTLLDSTDTAITATLGSGTHYGQQKLIVMTEASNSSTVSVTNHATSDPEIYTFDAVDEMLLLTWTGTEWETVKATATT